MKIKRMKKIRKTMEFYRIKYKFREPYKVVLDGEFLQAALEGQIQIAEQIPKMFGDAIPYVTRCIIHELKKRPGRFYDGAVMIGSKLKHLKCRHKGLIEPNECLLKLIRNNNADHIIMAVNNVKLRSQVRELPGVPVMYIRGRVPILEGKDAEENAVRKQLESVMLPNENEKKMIDQVVSNKNDSHQRQRRKRKAKGPNPLSVKKKKKKTTNRPVENNSNNSNSHNNSDDTKSNSNSNNSNNDNNNHDGQVQNSNVNENIEEANVNKSKRKKRKRGKKK